MPNQDRTRRTRAPTGAGPVAAAGPSWLKLGLAAGLGLIAGTMLFATEARGRGDGRREGSRDGQRAGTGSRAPS